MSEIQIVLWFWGISLVCITIWLGYSAHKQGIYKDEHLRWKEPKKSTTGFVGVKIGPLVIGEQIGTPEVKVKKDKK